MMTEQQRAKGALWWVRWWVAAFPGLALQRLTGCRKSHVGPMDGDTCLACGAPWFKWTRFLR